MKKIFTLLSLLSLAVAGKSQSTSLVISQVYGGGGGTGYYLYDYIELHNVSSSSINIAANTWSLQYGGSTGNIGGSSSTRYILPAMTIPAGGYYLIQCGSAGTSGLAISPTPDATTTTSQMALSNSNGKVALVNDTTLFKCGANATLCADATIAKIVDLVGFGKLSDSSKTNYEGWYAQGVVGDTLTVLNGKSNFNKNIAAVRKNSGCQDTQNNAADFDTIPSPVPRNSASPVFICSGTNPVKISSFSIQKSSATVAISWVSEQEFNNKVYIIQRSSDGIVWNDITSVVAVGNSSSAHNYTSTDASPLSGFNYYRLKSVCNDGSFNYSATRKLYFSDGFKVMITPNPVKDFINIYVSKNSNENITVKVTDLNGKVVRNITSGDASLSINTSGLSKGIYVVKVINANNITTKKILIQ